MYIPIVPLTSCELPYLGPLSCENPDSHMRTLMVNPDVFSSPKTTQLAAQLHQNGLRREMIHGFGVSNCTLDCGTRVRLHHQSVPLPLLARRTRTLWLFLIRSSRCEIEYKKNEAVHLKMKL